MHTPCVLVFVVRREKHTDEDVRTDDLEKSKTLDSEVSFCSGQSGPFGRELPEQFLKALEINSILFRRFIKVLI